MSSAPADTVRRQGRSPLRYVISRERIAAAMKATVAAFGRLDIAFNNAESPCRDCSSVVEHFQIVLDGVIGQAHLVCD